MIQVGVPSLYSTPNDFLAASLLPSLLEFVSGLLSLSPAFLIEIEWTGPSKLIFAYLMLAAYKYGTVQRNIIDCKTKLAWAYSLGVLK